MIVTLDGRRLSGNFESTQLLQALVDAVRRDHLPNRLVVQVSIDGETLLDPILSERLTQPVGGAAQIDLASADPQEIVVAALREAAGQVELAAGAHEEVASELQAGQVAQAIRAYGQLLNVWQVCRDTVKNAGLILNRDLGPLTAAGGTVNEHFTRLSAQLRDVRAAFDSRDFVLLGDILRYEMPDTCRNWNTLLLELADLLSE